MLERADMGCDELACAAIEDTRRLREAAHPFPQPGAADRGWRSAGPQSGEDHPLGQAGRLSRYESPPGTLKTRP